MNEPERLRELACWYREFAERAQNATIWDARLRTAENLEAEAERLESGGMPRSKHLPHRADFGARAVLEKTPGA